MEIIFSPDALEQLQYWKKSGNKKVIEKISNLIENIQRTPYEGIGKPEPLKHNWSGYWSRRITGDHRLVYKVENETILIAQLRFHYQ
jgi:toxin YoeB